MSDAACAAVILSAAGAAFTRCASLAEDDALRERQEERAILAARAAIEAIDQALADDNDD